MILVNRTFSEVTPESAEDGDHSDSGFIAEDVPYTFRELVQAMQEHPHPSRWPARGDVFEWLSTDYEVTDYSTGTQRQESLHYSRNNNPHQARYWRLAMKAARVLHA